MQEKRRSQSVEASERWVYESQRTEYKACTLTVRAIDAHITEVRLEGKTGEHFSILLGRNNLHILAHQLMIILDLEHEE